MAGQIKQRERADEIVSFYYLVFGHRVHAGMSPTKARKEAFDAVSLRYGIGEGRMRNIMTDMKCSRNVNRSAFLENAKALAAELQNVNSELNGKIERNERLLSLLNECIENER